MGMPSKYSSLSSCFGLVVVVVGKTFFGISSPCFGSDASRVVETAGKNRLGLLLVVELGKNDMLDEVEAGEMDDVDKLF